MPGNVFERLFVSSFVSPQIFFREDVGLRRRHRHHRHRLPRAAAPRVPGRLPHLHDRGAGALPPRLAALAPSPGDPGRRRRRGGAELPGGLGRLPADPHAALLRARARHAGERRVELHGRGPDAGAPRGPRPARARAATGSRPPGSAASTTTSRAATSRGSPAPTRRSRPSSRTPTAGARSTSPPASATTRATASTSRTAAGAWAWSPKSAPWQSDGSLGAILTAYGSVAFRVPPLFHSGGDAREENPPTDTIALGLPGRRRPSATCPSTTCRASAAARRCAGTSRTASRTSRPGTRWPSTASG